MGLLAALASFAGLEVDALATRLKRDAIAIAAVAIFVLVAAIFLLVAVYAALAGALGPIAAALVISGVSLVMALIVYLVMLALRASATREEARRRHSKERAALITAVATTVLPLAMQSRLLRRFGLPLGGLVAAGYLLSRDNKDADDEATKP